MRLCPDSPKTRLWLLAQWRCGTRSTIATTIRFNMINPETGNRIRMKTVDAETDQEVQRRDLVKGYEFRKNHYLLLTDTDFTA